MGKLRILITGASGLLGSTTALEATEDWRLPGWSRPETIAQVNSRYSNHCSTRRVQDRSAAPGAVRSLSGSHPPYWVIDCAALANIDAAREIRSRRETE